MFIIGENYYSIIRSAVKNITQRLYARVFKCIFIIKHYLIICFEIFVSKSSVLLITRFAIVRKTLRSAAVLEGECMFNYFSAPSIWQGSREIVTNNIDAFSHTDNTQLGYYLSGLLESDGTLIVPTLLSKDTPKISIVFNSKDLPLALHLKSTLGYGSIQKDANKSAINFVIRNKLGIMDLMSLINGKFRTPKISQLHLLIDWVNKNPRYSSLINEGGYATLDKLPLDTSSLNTNAWLSGFSEGDSTFQIRITEGDKYNHLSTTYEISQGRLDSELFEDYKDIMEKIAKLFLADLGVTYLSKYDRSGKQPFWRARNSSKAGAKEVIKYFNKYPLFSSKHLDFLNWKEAHNLIEIKAHHKKYGLEGLNKIKYLKNSMNNKRTEFSWSHLNNFYNRIK